MELLCQQLAFLLRHVCSTFFFSFSAPPVQSQRQKKDFYCFLSCLFPGALHTYLFTLEGQLPRLKFIWVPLYYFLFFARFMYPLLIQLEKMETFSCTKFLNRLFRPLRDEMLASRWSIASSSATGLLLARLSHFYGRFHSCQLHFQTALIFTHFPKKKLLYVIFCIMQTNLMRFQHRAADFIPFQCIFVCIHYITLVIWEMYLSILRLPFLVLRGIRRTWGVL